MHCRPARRNLGLAYFGKKMKICFDSELRRFVCLSGVPSFWD